MDKIKNFLIVNGKRAAIIAAVILLVAVLGGVGWFFIFSGSEEEHEIQPLLEIPTFMVTPAPPGEAPESDE